MDNKAEKNNAVYRIENLSLDHNDLMLNETIFHNANGYIGVRSCFEEGYRTECGSIVCNTIRGSYINGFYDLAEMKQAEKLYGLVEEKQTIVNVADTQTIRLYLGEEGFSMFDGTVLESSRWLDMDEGYTARRVLWRSPEGKEAEILIKRMASFTRSSLFTIEYCVRSVNYDGDITFVSAHKGDVSNYFDPNDPRVAAIGFRHLIPVSADMIDGASYLVSQTSKSGLSVCTGVKNIVLREGAENGYSAVDEGAHEDSCRVVSNCIQSDVMIKSEISGQMATCTMKTKINRGETVRLIKYTVFCDSIRHGDIKEHAVAEMDYAVSRKLKEFYNEQKEYLSCYWDHSLLEIDGDDEADKMIRYDLYQLLQSAGKDKFGGIPAKGLSGEGYEGHCFWDTEIFIQPFFMLTNPDISKNLIEYRYSILDMARENARMMGHKRGALYPWRTIMGRECSGYFPSGSAQYHINGDVAYAITAYYLATGDVELIRDMGAEIVFETARFWIDAGHFHNSRFYINEVTGPDEYTCLVNNNYYTNAAAQYNLHWAVRFCRMLKKTGHLAEIEQRIGQISAEMEMFEEAEKGMYLPYDEELGINPQDDSFLQKARWDLDSTPENHFPLFLNYHPLFLYRHQICKQADTVLAHFIFEDAQSVETIKKSFEYYEKITTHDSSLSTCIFSIVASKLGLEEKALAYFTESANMDLHNTYGNTKDGIHTANMGGTYMAVVYGFGGLRLKESGMYFAPALPEAWDGYRFRICFRGSRIQVDVRRNKCVFELISGEPKTIHVYGEAYLLEKCVTVDRQLCSKGNVVGEW